MSANYLKTDQQAIQNRPLPPNQTQNTFVPSGTAMVQANRGRKRKLPSDPNAAGPSASGPSSQTGTPAPGVGNDDEEDEEEVSKHTEEISL